jgi:hypothetical protein
MRKRLIHCFGLLAALLLTGCAAPKGAEHTTNPTLATFFSGDGACAPGQPTVGWTLSFPSALP